MQLKSFLNQHCYSTFKEVGEWGPNHLSGYGVRVSAEERKLGEGVNAIDLEEEIVFYKEPGEILFVKDGIARSSGLFLTDNRLSK